jgi:hypothetical protein
MASTKELLSYPTSVGVWSIDPDGQITDTQTIFGRIDIRAASLDTSMCKPR